jgi:formyltetrahydrofolate synthetase
MLIDGSECQIDSVDITATRRLDLSSRTLRECTSSH